MKDVEDLNKAEEIEVLQEALETRLEKLSPEDGDIILAHIDGEEKEFDKIFSCLNAGFAAYRLHNGKAVFLIGVPSGANLTLEELPEEKLNSLGWHKCDLVEVVHGEEVEDRKPIEILKYERIRKLGEDNG